MHCSAKPSLDMIYTAGAVCARQELCITLHCDALMQCSAALSTDIVRSNLLSSTFCRTASSLRTSCAAFIKSGLPNVQHILGGQIS